MSRLSRQDIDAIVGRHHSVFERPLRERVRAPIVAVSIVAYLVFAWWMFGIGLTISNGNWGIAGNYLADWVSYEVRPDIEYDGDYLRVEFPRFSPLGKNPDPAWLQKTSQEVERQVVTDEKAGRGTETSVSSTVNSFMVEGAPGTQDGGSSAVETVENKMEPSPGDAESIVEIVVSQVNLEIGSAKVEVLPRQVTVDYRGQTLLIDVEPEQSVRAQNILPEWATQKTEDGDIFLQFGFAGTLEVESDEVKVRHRFIGWENFWFDTNSPFWNKSLSQVVGLVASDDRIDPDMSNAALAWNNILYNAEWQHADVWIKLLQTIVMAFVGTLFASLLAFPLAFAAARNISHSRPVNQILKRFFDFLRCVDMLIWALFFTRAFGPGPLAGISAIFFTDTGTLGKLYSEALENIDDKQREGIRSVGAAPVLVQRYGVVPQVLPIFASQSLYFWESNTRSATIIGAVGAGGIGLKLWEAMRTNADWENVAYMVLLILATVFIFDGISNAIRSRLMGRDGASS